MAEWEAYDKIEPIGDWKNDIRMAVIAATITNLFISVYGKKGSKPVTVDQFIPNWSGEVKLKHQDPEDMKKVLLALASNFKKEDKDGSR